MKNLSDYSEQELLEELTKRKKNKRPVPLFHPDWETLIEKCEENIKSVDDYGRKIKDADHCIFECAMEAIYGPDIWDWYNRNLK